MVADIFKKRLVIFFIEGLSQPLSGWVKSFKTETL
jgi:hypothetical protein